MLKRSYALPRNSVMDGENYDISINTKQIDFKVLKNREIKSYVIPFSKPNSKLNIFFKDVHTNPCYTIGWIITTALWYYYKRRYPTTYPNRIQSIIKQAYHEFKIPNDMNVRNIRARKTDLLFFVLESIAITNRGVDCSNTRLLQTASRIDAFLYQFGFKGVRLWASKGSKFGTVFNDVKFQRYMRKGVKKMNPFPFIHIKGYFKKGIYTPVTEMRFKKTKKSVAVNTIKTQYKKARQTPHTEIGRRKFLRNMNEIMKNINTK
jgi:hypothetical protein